MRWISSNSILNSLSSILLHEPLGSFSLHPLTHSPTHPLIHSLTHPLTHPLTFFRVGLCPTSPSNNYCGAYISSCSGYSTLSFNTIETVYMDGALSGPFRRVFKAYSYATDARCSGLLLQSWDVSGRFQITGPATCGGSCIVSG